MEKANNNVISNKSKEPPKPIYIFHRDENGELILWNFKIKRPIMKFNAHDQDDYLKIWKLDKLKLDQLNEESTTFTSSGSVGVENVENLIKLDKKIIINFRNFCKFGACEKGRCMALKLFHNPNDETPHDYFMLLIYDNGYVKLWTINNSIDDDKKSERKDNECECKVVQNWCKKEHKGHDRKFAISTASDNKIVKYTFTESLANEPIVDSVLLKYSGISDVRIRSDGKIFATAGWDSNVYTIDFTKIITFVTTKKVDQNNNNYLIGGGKDQRISLWEIY
ncbi:1581_t:CDS:2 [Entrophospora sp. SA101]|nr:1581_t:CDS:2 [Entrophospora sp. SA101]